ncbi:unnamed protein product, partial [Rotaria sordida]
YSKVLYPYRNNDLIARTLNSYLKAVRKAIRKSNGDKESVDAPFSIDVPTSDLIEWSSRYTLPNSSWQRTRTECYPTSNADTNATNTASPTIVSISCTDQKAMSLSSSTIDSDLMVTQGTPTSNSISNINVRKRSVIDSFSSPRKEKKSKKVQEDDDTSSSDTESDKDDFIRSIEPIKPSKFKGRRLIKIFCGTHVFISLEESANVDNDDTSFPSSLIFKSSENEPGVNLLKIFGTQDKANLYVTMLIQLIYTMEELVVLQPADTYNDN